MTTITEGTPRVWIGCLHHYNAGSLIGDWFDALGADDVTLADVHEGSGRGYAGCEELWCFDHEHLPLEGELSPAQAADWGRVLAEVDEHLRPALNAWVLSGDYIAEGTSDLPLVSEFMDRYCGLWESFDEYAQQLADDIGLLDGVPEDVGRYFDWGSWTRDLGYDYTTVVASSPECGAYIFRSY